MKKNISAGISGLIKSRKGMLCLLILGSSVYLAAKQCIDGMSFAAVVGTIGTIYMWSNTKTKEICNHDQDI